MTVSFNSRTDITGIDSFAATLQTEVQAKSTFEDNILGKLSRPTLTAPDDKAILYATPPMVEEVMIEEACLKSPPAANPVKSNEAILEKARTSLVETANQAKIEAYKTLGSIIFKSVAMILAAVISGGGLAIPVAALSAFVLISALINVIVAHINIARAEEGKAPINLKEFFYNMVAKALEKLSLPESIRKHFTVELFDQATDSALGYANKAQGGVIGALPGGAIFNAALDQGLPLLLNAVLPDAKEETKDEAKNKPETKAQAEGA